MAYDDATVPMYNQGGQGEPPTWPTTPPARGRIWRGGRRPAAGPGCGVALAVIAAFLVGAAFAAILTAILVAPRALPPASSNHTTAALRLTLTDNFFDRGLTASSANGLLTNIQTHIQPDGQLKLSGQLRGVPVGSGQTATFVFAPTVSQGRIKVVAISGSVGALPVPAAALGQLATALNQQLAPASAVPIGGGQRLTVQRITFADGELTINYA